jgi:hypothetical protein
MRLRAAHRQGRSQQSMTIESDRRRRIPNIETLEKEISIWECDRNINKVCVNWRFRTEDALCEALKDFSYPAKLMR